MKKNTYVMVISITVFLFVLQPVFAAPIPPVLIRKEVKEERKENTEERRASLSAVRSNLSKRAALIKATVTAKGTDSLTVVGEDGKVYIVKVDGLTQWRRKFWGKSDFAETSINDILNIYGKWNNEQMSEIQAVLIRNISIQKRNGVFFGTVKSLSSNGWVMTTIMRGEQTVTVSGSTRFIDRRGIWVGQAAILTGHRVRVRGLWDGKNNTITEVVEVKDFDLPAQPTATPKS